MQLDTEQIFAANWSYRPAAREALGVADNDCFPIVECVSCGFIYAGLLPGMELLHGVYDLVIDEAAARRSNFSFGSLATRMSYLSTLMGLLSDASEITRILDFGCGFGPTLHLLRNIPEVSAVGYETSPLRIAELTNRNLKVTDDLAEIGRLAPFSAVILDNVLEHVPDPKATLDLIRQWCGPGALLYISVPDANIEHMRRQRLALERGGIAAMDINPWEHLNYFDLKHLDSCLLKAGFSPLRQADLPESVTIGLRPDKSPMARLKNGLASMIRLLGYIREGDASSTVTRRFYRLLA